MKVYIHMPFKHYKRINLLIDYVSALEMTMKKERAEINEVLSDI
jgi:hypothetical protein